MTTFIKPAKVVGKSLTFRDARCEDAKFILELRTDPSKGRHLSATSSELSAQVSWLERYVADPSQIYFIIEDQNGERVGTVRLYDQQGSSFCWGSWILKAGVPSGYAIESALMVYAFARSLGFTAAHFDVRKGNESVWHFHERMGAVRTGETEQDIFYSIDAAAIEATTKRYRRYLPNPIQITPKAPT